MKFHGKLHPTTAVVVPPSSPTASRRDQPGLCLKGMVQPHAGAGQEAARQGVPLKLENMRHFCGVNMVISWDFIYFPSVEFKQKGRQPWSPWRPWKCMMCSSRYKENKSSGGNQELASCACPPWFDIGK